MDLSTLGPSAAVVIVVIAFLKFMTDAMGKLNSTIEKDHEMQHANLEATKEMRQFLQNLNGKLERAIKEKLDIN